MIDSTANKISDRNEPILILGAGVFGLATAHSLALRGFKNISVFDRFAPPGPDSTSTDINKCVRADYGTDLFYQKLALEAISKWKLWSQESMAKNKIPLYNETGILSLSRKETEYQASSKKSLNEVGIDVVDNCNLPLDYYPGLKSLRSASNAGYYNKVGGPVDAASSIKFLANKVRELGVRIFIGERGKIASFLEIDSIKVGIVLESGHIVKGKIIVCAGAWTPSLLPETRDKIKSIGQPIFYLKLTRQSKETHRSNSPIWFSDISNGGYYGFPHVSGHLKIGVHGPGYLFTENGIYCPKTKITHPGSDTVPQVEVENLNKFLSEFFPDLTAEITSQLCWYCDSVDGDFLIDKVPNQPNVYVATGGSGHAFKFLPIIGDICADVFEGKQTKVSSRFRWREMVSKKEAARQSGEAGSLNDTPLANSNLIRLQNKL